MTVIEYINSMPKGEGVILPSSPPKEKKNRSRKPEIWPLFLLFLKIGAFTIGGGYAMIPLIRAEMVERRLWISEKDFIDNLAVSQSIPGPIIVNLSLVTGFRLLGLRGALPGLLGTILPSFLIILLIAAFLWEYQQIPAVQAAFRGIKPVVVALIAAAAFKLGRHIFRRLDLLLMFCLFLVTLVFFGIHPILVIITGGLIGLLRPLLPFKS